MCLLMLGTEMNVARADEHGEGNELNYSVFQSYRFLKSTNTNQAAVTQSYAAAMLPGWNATTDKLTGMARDMYGPSIAVPGGTFMEKTQILMGDKLRELGINRAEWANTRNVTLAHASFVDYEQVLAGHKVVFSNLSFRFGADGKLQRIKTRSYGSSFSDITPELTAADVLAGTAMTQGMAGMAIVTREIEKDWVWFPIPSANGYTVHPAWAFSMTGTAQEMPFELTGYVDAMTGELLYRSNAVNETFEVTVKGKLYASAPTAPTTDLPISDMRVSVTGSTDVVTDANGYADFPSAFAPANVTYHVNGPWSYVREGGNPVSFQAVMLTSGATYDLPSADTSSKEFRAVSAFYYVNRIHDYMKSFWPTFTGMDNAINTNVDLTNNQQCNAFYQNGQYSINFYPPQPSCRAFSIVSDIVYHEYGHGICYRFYSSQGTNFSNGALGEAYADIWAMGLNRDGVVGDGAYLNGGNIRSYTGAPKVYPTDIRGEVHADGEIIAGAWWDVAQNMGSIDDMMDLFALTHYDVPNAPNGMEGDLYYDVLISALMNDDNDGNLGNGTPHFTQIAEAFARHGIYLLNDVDFEHTEVAHQAANTPVSISGNLILTNPSFFNNILLHYRNRYAGTWDSVAMTNTSGSTYTAQIPAMPGGAIVDYFFSARDIINEAVGVPSRYNPYANASLNTLPYQYGVGLNIPRYKYDFEGDITGWQIGMPSDNASSGLWVHDVPVGTFTSDNLPIQPNNDHTTGSGKCLVTGNSASPTFNEVANGITTVMTPSFNLPFSEPVVEYYRWYSNNRGNSANLKSDFWSVEMHSGTSPFWQKVDYTKEPDQRWRRRIFRVSEYLPGVNTSIQLRFIAEDAVNNNAPANGQNVVEAAIDDFIIYEGTPLNISDMPENIKAEVYPNPADDKVNIALPEGSKGSITMYDITGKVITTVNVTEATTNYSIQTSGLVPGNYMVLMQTQYAVQNTTIVVSHR